ncbi:uncharacterized protein LOC119364255 [Triticum dicoccoides]|uniref:uncharacterized protein LOC119364255 n=1 Tax=Triticum dicoccoides TaxID=85692 RepID=UPI00188E07EB|nr:uncharacterized protein LOC119364255 [Triticum dicoccoides]
MVTPVGPPLTAMACRWIELASDLLSAYSPSITCTYPIQFLQLATAIISEREESSKARIHLHPRRCLRQTIMSCCRMKTGIASKFLISHVIGKSFSIDGTNPLQCTLLEASNDMLTLKIFSHRNSERMVATLGIKVAALQTTLTQRTSGVRSLGEVYMKDGRQYQALLQRRYMLRCLPCQLPISYCTCL